jgi:hypothetical protein
MVWNEASAKTAYKAFYETYGMTAEQYRHRHRSGDKSLFPEVARKAANICHAVNKYAGGAEVLNRGLGISIDRTRIWSREAVLNGYRQVVEKWGISPHQLLNDYKSGKVQFDESVARDLARLVGVTKKHFASSRAIYDLLGFKPPSRPRKRRVRKASIQSIKEGGPGRHQF